MIHLIGVDHSVQHDGRPGLKTPPIETLQSIRQEFANFLFEKARLISADCIGEEFNEEALEWSKASCSIAEKVATELGIKHIFCDPDNDVRKKIGIYKTQKDIADKRREEYWLNLLFNSSCKEVIFVIGASHVKSFDSLLKSKDIGTKILTEFFKKEYYSG